MKMAEEAEEIIKVDARGMACPGPITALTRAYRKAKEGQVIEVWATDPGFKSDVQAWAERTGSEILELKESDGVIIARIRVRRRS